MVLNLPIWQLGTLILLAIAGVTFLIAWFKGKIPKRQLGTVLFLLMTVFAFSVAWINAPPIQAGEAFQSPDDFEDVIGYVEWDSWGNFSAAPDQNPPPSLGLALSANFLKLSPAQRLLSAGRCEAVEIHENYILANFKFGTKAYVQYSVGPLRQVTKIEFGLAPMKLMAGGTEDEGGWELADKEISLFSGSEEDLVEQGPAMADTCRSIITIRENSTGTNGMSFATMPTTSNYTLDKKVGFHGYGLEAGGDKSLNEIGDSIAKASGVEFYNLVNSTQEAITTHDDGDGIIDLLFVTYDDWSTSAAAGKAAGSMSIIRRFTHRISVAASKAKNFARGVATAPYKGLAFIAGKAKTVVSKVARTAVNTLKAGVTFIPKLIKGISKWVLIPVVCIGGLVIILVIKKWQGTT